ncbi:Glycoside hydrolase family 76 protein [Mycena indigotica]|uniref:Glycoside hydrolase family 76 protein n=1 Tax=Mycena indigotica TaxID=2126181 RepID=A0A8H6S5E2_9AGAR|nr:Glycoside hydrolase family 76 protein [Mycena indigotica]KAF7293420.1 Glycoside hydrolase family 76 protein [Mycena indigotica]
MIFDSCSCHACCFPRYFPFLNFPLLICYLVVAYTNGLSERRQHCPHLMRSLPLLVAVVVVAQVASQPQASSWRKPNVTTLLEDRIRLAQGAIAQAVSELDSTTSMFPDLVDTYGFSGALYSLLAEFDQLANRSQYAVDLVGYFGAASAVTAANYSGLYVRSSPALNNGLNFGHGAVVAYKAYNNSLFLQFAVDAWSAAVPYTLTQAALDAGKTSNKNFTLSPDCQGVSMAGGTFWVASSVSLIAPF